MTWVVEEVVSSELLPTLKGSALYTLAIEVMLAFEEVSSVPGTNLNRVERPGAICRFQIGPAHAISGTGAR